MPIVKRRILEGRDDETKSRLKRTLTDAIVNELPGKPEHVRVAINEVAESNDGDAGKKVQLSTSNTVGAT